MKECKVYYDEQGNSLVFVCDDNVISIPLWGNFPYLITYTYKTTTGDNNDEDTEQT